MKPIIAELVRHVAEETLREAREGKRPNVKDIMASPQVQEVARVAEDEIDSLPGEKPWWQSKGFLGAMVASIISIFGAFGFATDAIEPGEAAATLGALATGVAGVIAMYGRIKAKKTIK